MGSHKPAHNGTASSEQMTFAQSCYSSQLMPGALYFVWLYAITLTTERVPEDKYV